ncbi:dihydrolipoyl dehydrogenase [Nocardioides sp. KC13]|uniref:Dihydrolipoyl dehydrogenase n=1 Tax=Nocardioides turkmenicus TaxID=2711220 RepID=A0A6M1R0D0_9ACTN|nr:dihydrolipoyl dehydrogenase [Nocardioides sp. KC13]NGN95763.1 dihydrolipoyl dehydrogenase [Nocardioides sp. KC13]
MNHVDVIVLGAGPGGYTAAVRAAQLGRSVAVVEDRYWGGVCLNVGCIPAKALLRNAEIAHLLSHQKEEFSIRGDASVDYSGSWRRSRRVADASAKGVHFLMRKNKITEIDGWGMLAAPQADGTLAIEVTSRDGATETYTCDDLIIATGATVRSVPGVEPNGRNIVTYEELILTEELPGSIVIGGSGAIGVELAYVMKSFGVDVTIVEYADRMVPTEDADVSKELLRQYRKLGIDMLTSTAVTRAEDTGSGVRVTVSPVGDAGETVLEADTMLAAFGFAPRVDGYGLDKLGVAITERGAIAIDDRGRTNVPHVYAIGDVTGKLMLAHVAEGMGVVAAETIAGAETMPIDIDMVPRATFCQPQIASFGYTEAQAAEKGYDVRTATFPFSANGKARGLGETVGFVKVVADAEHNELLGAHLIGPDVTEQLPVLTLAQQWDLTADEVARNVFAHPTLSEAVKEAVHGIAGHMINL